jgi:predicted lipoprotein
MANVYNIHKQKMEKYADNAHLTTREPEFYYGPGTLLYKNAVDMAIVAAAADKDIVAAGAEFGRDLGNKSFVFAVKTTAKVKLVDENFIVLNVPGAPAQDTFNIPIGLALSGNPLRDVTGKITFGDFYDQTQYQDVANALKDLVRSSIIDQLDLQNLTGKTLSIYGAWNNGPLKNVYNIQPTSIVVK